jgi:hypothetical protein
VAGRPAPEAVSAGDVPGPAPGRRNFCDPQRPWQRGSNEHTNGLLGQYFSNGTDLSRVGQQQLNVIARRLNRRPRKTLGYQTPADRLAAIAASTGLNREALSALPGGSALTRVADPPKAARPAAVG